MTEPLTLHMAVVLALTVLALGLFATERIRLESAALLVLVCLLVAFSALPYRSAGEGAFDPATLFLSFGNEALVAVCALMVLGKGIETTHALQPAVTFVSRNWSRRPMTMFLAVMVLAASLSAFVNNTPIVVMLLPALMAIARHNDMAPSRILMSVGLVTIIGGMATTIGTSTNLLVVTLSDDIAGVGFDMFDFSWYVLVAGSVGVVYLWLLGPRLTPQREGAESRPSARSYMATLHIEADSPLVGRNVAELLDLCRRKLQIDHIQHQDDIARPPLPTMTLRAGDMVFVRGNRHDLKEAERELDAPLTQVDTQTIRQPGAEPRLAEVVVTQDSLLDHASLESSDFSRRFGLTPIAVHRPGESRGRGRARLEKMELHAGDILLCEGRRSQYRKLTEETPLLLLSEDSELPFTGRAWTALAIMGSVVVVAALGLLSIAIAALLGVGLMIATHCLGWRHVREALSTQVILVIVVSLALGRALQVTGGDEFLADLLKLGLGDASPAMVVTALMLFTAVLTNVVTNNAAAVITTPIAVQMASRMDIAVEPLVLAVLFGANLSFVTPIGYQTNLLVYSAGGYRFSDFIRVGAPLTLVMWVILSWLLKWNYGL